MKFRGNWFLSNRSITQMLMPDTLTIEEGRVRIRRKKFLGLATDEDEIRLDRIASVRVRKGLLGGRLLIETSGGAIQDIEFSGIWKWQADKIATAIRELI